MGDFITNFLVAGGIMGVLDALWLSVLAKNFYRQEIGSIILDKPNMKAAIIFYLIYILGVVLFVVSPALEKQSIKHALLYGLAFGFVAYATYDLTSLAVIKGFTNKVVVIDMVWGSLLTATVCSLSYLVKTKLL